MPILVHTTDLPCPAERAFEFLTQPANLEKISPPAAGLKFVEAPDRLQLGSRFVLKVAAFGTIQTMTHEITEFEPLRFRETSVTTPMKKFSQEYRIIPVDAQHSQLVTTVDFEPPGGMLGFLLTADKISDQLEDGFDARALLLQKALA